MKKAVMPGEAATSSGVVAVTSAVPVPAILERVADTYGIRPDDLTGRGRAEPMVSARHLAMYLCRVYSGLSLPAIGSAFNRDHTTVLHGIRRIATTMGNDQEFASFANEIGDKLKEEHNG